MSFLFYRYILLKNSSLLSPLSLSPDWLYLSGIKTPWAEAFFAPRPDRSAGISLFPPLFFFSASLSLIRQAGVGDLADPCTFSYFSSAPLERPCLRPARWPQSFLFPKSILADV